MNSRNELKENLIARSEKWRRMEVQNAKLRISDKHDEYQLESSD